MWEQQRWDDRFGDRKKTHFVLLGTFSPLPVKNGLVWFTGKRKKVLEVPDKEGKEISQSSLALQVGPRQTLLTALCGPGTWPGERNWAEMPLPTLASSSGCCLLQWHTLGKVSNTNGPQTEPSAFCGSLLQELPAVGRDGAVCVTGVRIWPPALWSEAGEWCGLGPWVLPWVVLWSDHSIRDDLRHWAWTCFELRCIAYTCKTNLGTHKCVTNYFAPLQSVC